VKNILLGIFIGSVMGTGVGVEAVRAADSSGDGASLAWTSKDPLLVEARGLVSRGELTKADKLLADDKSDAAAEMLEMIRRFRREYDVSEADLLEKLKSQIPGVAAADLKRWRDAGELQFRTIDGEVRYFRREPSNLFRFCDEAIKRRTQSPGNAAAGWKLTDHLARVVAAAEKTGNVEVEPIKHTITYRATIPAGAGGMKQGSTVRVWLPFPREYRQQKDVKLITSEPAPTLVADNDAPHRTLYYELKVSDPSKPIVIKNVYSYTSYAYYPKLDDASAKPLAADWPGKAEYLAERLPHVAFTPELKAKVKEIVGDETNPLARARKIYHWVDANMKYCAEEEYCLIPSFSTKALASLKGDCGIQGNLFITMCRAAGIPARWQSGWETKKVGFTMHDWAEFYVEPWGWLPADASYGLQKSDDPKVREFYFGHQDAYRMIVNSDFGRPLTPPKQSLRSEPADFQRGEAEVDGRNLYFDDWDYDFRFEQDRE
jgi:transglutaminase-like putative cysteine protease